MKETELTYKIRPAARLIHTIGSDLIGDSFAALVELVKKINLDINIIIIMGPIHSLIVNNAQINH